MFSVAYGTWFRDNKGREHILEVALDNAYPKCPPSISAVCSLLSLTSFFFFKVYGELCSYLCRTYLTISVSNGRRAQG